MNNLADSNSSRKNEMVALWEAWARDHEVAFPVRFNMYEFLNKKKKQKQRENQKQQKKKAGTP